MIYFDNAATSFPKAPGVAEAMTKFLAHDAANPGRAGHKMAVAAEKMLDDARLKLTRFFGGRDFHRMVFVMNTTDALNIAIKGVLADAIAAHLKGGVKPHVITSVLEHNSVSRPLQSMLEQGQIELTRLDCNDDGFVTPASVKTAITPNTRLVVLTHASNVLGTMQDAAAIGKITRAAGVLFCLDAAQTAGVVPIDVEAMCVDLLAFPGHKSLLGPTGIGGLYVGDRVPIPAQSNTLPARPQDKPGVEHFRTWREGGTGGDSATPTQPALFPYYLEGGTPNTVGVVGMIAGLEFILAHGVEKHLLHEQEQVQRIIDKLGADPRFKIYGTRDATKRVGTVSFSLEGFEPSDIGAILDDSFDIAVRPGLHCSPYAHKRLGTFPTGTVRISPGVFNTQYQLDTLLEALGQVAL
jgi:cysteine desulfurase/selenocysteine lyase